MFSKLVTCLVFLIILQICRPTQAVGDIIYAVNAGGDEHTDINGITYDKDPLAGEIGIASDYGKRLDIGRVPIKDHILYQTERYHTSSFGYDLPIPEDGTYVLVLKFCEVYFDAPNQKVFDVVLNGEHTAISDLDIFAKVDRGVAHDEYVQFMVHQGKLYINGEDSDIQGNKIKLEFIKGYKDNPKINAFYLMKGTIDNVPKLPPLDTQATHAPDLPSEDKENDVPLSKSHIIHSIPEEYEPEEEFNIMLPVFCTIGLFIPVLFCLCKL